MALQILLLLPLLFIQFLPSYSIQVYNVEDFGARQGGEVDTTTSFLKAWDSACGSTEPAVVHVPEGRFLLGPAMFSGPCMSREVEVRIEGTVLAPQNDYEFLMSKRWIKFHSVEGLTIHGGTIYAGGSTLWRCKAAHQDCPQGPISLTISDGKNITVSGLTSIDSNKFHMWINRCNKVKVHDVKLVAPGDSPNTDGIHVQNSSRVTISDSSMSTGDDCISIGPGTTKLRIKNVYCGPGHGISIGSLGIRKVEEGVEDVKVEGVVLNGTQNGLRIKTWGRPTDGFVSGVLYKNVTMHDVKNPIIIDQNYCPHGKCPHEDSGIKISDITYSDIKGSSSSMVAVKFYCSPSKPCSDIRLKDVHLTYDGGDYKLVQSDCKHARGTAVGGVVPTSCLK